MRIGQRFQPAILFLAAVCIPGAESASISLSNGVHLRVASNLSEVSGSGSEAIRLQMAPASGNSFYRVFRDGNGLAIFAYEIQVDLEIGGDAVQLTVKPVGNEFAAGFPNADGGKPTPTMAVPREMPTLRSGDETSVEVFEIPGQGVKVVDTIQLRIDATPGAEHPEASDQILLSGLKVSVNGSPIPEATESGAVSGSYVMFYIPGRGGYFIAVDKPAGRSFIQAGSVDGKRLQFTADNENFECTTDAQILLHAERGELWVYHDRGYRPQGNWTNVISAARPRTRGSQFFAAAADTLDWWLR